MKKDELKEKYDLQLAKFAQDGKGMPVIRHYLWWAIHNCISHPTVGLFPFKFAFDFHVWLTNKLYKE